MLIIEQLKQGSDEWFDERLGSIGGSQITIVASKGDGYQKLLYQKAAEILSGVHEETFKSKYMDRGNEFESEGRDCYAQAHIVDPRIVGIVKYDQYKHYSPDFLIDDNNGFGEIKVRIPSVFIKFHENRNIPTADRRQIQWGFKITERDYCDYITYCPEIEKHGSMSGLIVIRIYPDPEEIKRLNAACNRFIGEMKNLVDKLKGI